MAASCTASEGSTVDPSTEATTVASSVPTTVVGDPATSDPVIGNPVMVEPGSHTVAELGSVADYEQLAKNGIAGQSVLKFSITEFSTDPEIEWLDSAFYTLHDEWYWFQLLNGSTVRGFDAAPTCHRRCAIRDRRRRLRLGRVSASVASTRSAIHLPGSAVFADVL
jgi:hypothetical protein